MGRDLKKEVAHGPRNSAVSVFSPGHSFFIVINCNDEIDVICGHPFDIFGAREGKAFHCPKLCVRMKVPDDLNAVKTLEYRVDFFMTSVERHHPFVLSGRSLETEGMFDNKPVLKLIAEKKAQAFPFVDLRRAQQ